MKVNLRMLTKYQHRRNVARILLRAKNMTNKMKTHFWQALSNSTHALYSWNIRRRKLRINQLKRLSSKHVTVILDPMLCMKSMHGNPDGTRGYTFTGCITKIKNILGNPGILDCVTQIKNILGKPKDVRLCNPDKKHSR